MRGPRTSREQITAIAAGKPRNNGQARRANDTIDNTCDRSRSGNKVFG
jgi:hypothetical protein